MIKINLLSEGKRPAAVRKRRELKVPVSQENLAAWLLLVGLVPGLVACGVYWWMLAQQKEERRVEINDLQRQYDELRPIIAEVQAFKDKQTALQRKIDIINQLKVNQRGPVRIMDQVSKALPELLWLDRMEVSSNSVRLIGRAYNENAVANFIENLDRMEDFQEPNLRHMRETTGGIYTYEIFFRYQLPKPEPDQAAAG